MKKNLQCILVLITILIAWSCDFGVAYSQSTDNGDTSGGKVYNKEINSSSEYYPGWRDFVPARIITLDYDSSKSSTENGAILADTILALTPGQRLEIGTGTFSINRWFNITVSGTSSAPIEITAREGASPVITRPNANQNVINIGSSTPVEYLILSNLEITGGDTLLKLYHCSNVWIHKSHIHNGNGVGIAANSENTDSLYITDNRIHDCGGTAEGMYLGANNGAKIMSNSIIASNHVYNCFGSQGDGIEVKQGSYNNWIVNNLVHDTNYPCITVYGTNGNPVNVIEKNILYNSNDNTMQVQGEALIRNNLIMSGVHAGFRSKYHQGSPTNLKFIHNTVISSNTAAYISDWNGKTGMVFANNALYSRNSYGIRFSGGTSGVSISGNVAYGSVSGISGGYISGNGLTDFMNVNWQATARDAAPSGGSPLKGTADPAYLCSDDLNGSSRTTAVSGALEVRPF